MGRRDYRAWLTCEGTLHIGDDVVRLKVSNDLVKYYKHLIDKEIKLFTNTPAHGAHITLWNPKIHGKLPDDKKKFLKKFYGKNKLKFEYSNDIIEGGRNKNFRNFYVKVRGISLSTICSYLDNGQERHLHLTICNTKNGVKPYIWLK